MKEFTDKWGTVLEKYKNVDIDYLEIGLYKGESLPLWKKYFGCNSRIYGIDINLSQVSIDSSTNFQLYEMNALDNEKFNTYFADKQFDVIIDDSCPNNHLKIFSMYSNLLKSNGVYIIETYKNYENYLRDFTFLTKAHKNFIFQLVNINGSLNIKAKKVL